MENENTPDFRAYPMPSPESAMLEKWNIFDKAAKKDMRWWFFALLMIGMAYVGFERWESSKERDQLRGEITSVRESQLAFVTAKNDVMMTAIINNTRALESNTQTLNRMENRKDREP